MSLTVNAKSYVQDRVSPDSVGYTGPANSLSIKDTFLLARTYPKPTPTFSGVARMTVKQVKTVTLTGALTPSSDIIFNLGTSIPVGAANADIDVACADLGAWLASAEGKAAIKGMDVNS